MKLVSLALGSLLVVQGTFARPADQLPSIYPNQSLQWDHFDEGEHYRKTIGEFEFDDGDGRGTPGLPGWIDPRESGGSMLDLVGNGLREPVNAIISGHSDPQILSEAGLRDYVRTIGFSFECLDLHLGGLQRADLGDGNGWITEQFEYRETEGWGAPGRWVGACWESLYGGNHFRVWKQNGTIANTGAWFLAVSKEKDLRHHHTIDTNGYNNGRNLLVEAAIRGGRWKIWKWKAKVSWNDELLDAGKRGINHDIEQDGRVAVLTVERVIDIPLLPDLRVRSLWLQQLLESPLMTLSLIFNNFAQILFARIL
ncbi:hypothetical protein CBS101457_006130 [Exobasidium rhododendri]|nr:hypothetical protein CBS101457_006130 [Exobasidium rhododendri]